MNDTDFIAAMQQGLPPLPTPDPIQRGNEGIDPGTWTGRTGPNEYAPLPQYPQPADLPERPTHQREPEPFEARVDREARRAALSDVAFAGACIGIGALGSLLLQGVVS